MARARKFPVCRELFVAIMAGFCVSGFATNRGQKAHSTRRRSSRNIRSKRERRIGPKFLAASMALPVLWRKRHKKFNRRATAEDGRVLIHLAPQQREKKRQRQQRGDALPEAHWGPLEQRLRPARRRRRERRTGLHLGGAFR